MKAKDETKFQRSHWDSDHSSLSHRDSVDAAIALAFSGWHSPPPPLPPIETVIEALMIQHSYAQLVLEMSMKTKNIIGIGPGIVRLDKVG